ncbi:MAG TPA: hypothetical protein VMA72_06665 [Streptosporangiaceae bacterium]|nr:hypothetical protein [Streptosporangiaceae bacterium]
MHPATMQGLAAQRGSDLYAEAAAARRARQAHRSQLAEQLGKLTASESAGAALRTLFCQTLAVVSNSDAASRKTPDRSPHRGPHRWTVTGLSGFRRVAGSPSEPQQPAMCTPSN